MLLPSFPEIPPHLLRVARPLTFLGEYEALAGAPYYAATCEAETVCDLLAVSIDAFAAWLQRDAGGSVCRRLYDRTKILADLG